MSCAWLLSGTLNVWRLRLRYRLRVNRNNYNFYAREDLAYNIIHLGSVGYLHASGKPAGITKYLAKVWFSSSVGNPETCRKLPTSVYIASHQNRATR